MALVSAVVAVVQGKGTTEKRPITFHPNGYETVLANAALPNDLKRRKLLSYIANSKNDMGM